MANFYPGITGRSSATPAFEDGAVPAMPAFQASEVSPQAVRNAKRLLDDFLQTAKRLPSFERAPVSYQDQSGFRVSDHTDVENVPGSRQLQELFPLVQRLMAPELGYQDFVMWVVDLMRANSMPARGPGGDNGWDVATAYCGNPPGAGGTFTTNPGGDGIWCSNHANLGTPVDGWVGTQSIHRSDHYTSWKRYPVDVFGGWAQPVADFHAARLPASDINNDKRLLWGYPKPSPGLADDPAAPHPEIALPDISVFFPSIQPYIPGVAQPLPTVHYGSYDELVRGRVFPEVFREIGDEVDVRTELVVGRIVTAEDWWRAYFDAVATLLPQYHARVQVRTKERPFDAFVEPIRNPNVSPFPAPDTHVPEVSVQASHQPPIIFEGYTEFGPPRYPNRERKNSAVYRGLIHALAMATYGGGTIRALWQSVPADCRSKSRTGKRKYSSMLADIARCWDRIDWDKFRILLGETLAKYAVEGKIIRQVNRFPSGNMPYRGLGVATSIYHASPGSDFGSSDPRQAPLSGGRQDPFSFLTEGLKSFNQAIGPYVGVKF